MSPAKNRRPPVAAKTKRQRVKTPLIPVMVISGSSASQRTKAVAMLAKELKSPLQRVDLGAVVSRYLGETEKNLNRLLETAERRDAILYFDDADALFGTRSSVREVHDRYSNLESGYLLDRLEQHEGLTILATSRRGPLDKRLQKYVHVPLGPGPSKKTPTKSRKK